MNPRTWARAISLCLAMCVACPCGAQTPAKSGSADKILRYSFPVAETGFDPAQINDLYSAIVIANVLEAPYEYDYLARPAKVRPNLAEAMPEVSGDFTLSPSACARASISPTTLPSRARSAS